MAVSTQPAVLPVDFDGIYAEAHRDPARVPWDDQKPHRALVSWLNHVAPSLIRCGGRVAVVGCGLGDDARELLRRGYDVVAFDCSTEAIEWAREIDPDHADCYHVADLTALPSKWHHRFDLVVEINTIQAVPPERRSAIVRPLATLPARHGHVLIICRGTLEPVVPEDGPPWALTLDELASLTREAGLEPEGAPCRFEDDKRPDVLRIRGLYRRAE